MNEKLIMTNMQSLPIICPLLNLNSLGLTGGFPYIAIEPIKIIFISMGKNSPARIKNSRDVVK